MKIRPRATTGMAFILILVAIFRGCFNGSPPDPTPTLIPNVTMTPVHTVTPGPPWMDWWTFGSMEDWPEKIEGHLVGYVQIKMDSLVWSPDKNNVLLPYENPEWGKDHYNSRLHPKAGKWIMVWARGDGDYSYDMPRPFSFDGGALGYLVMHEQIIDGKELWTWDLPGLYIRVQDVGQTWMVGQPLP